MPKEPEVPKEIEHNESDYEVECSDDTPSQFIRQVVIPADRELRNAKLGKRTYRQSELPEGPGITHRRETKRFRKAKKVKAAKTGNSLLDYLNSLDEKTIFNAQPIQLQEQAFHAGLDRMNA